MTWSAACAVSAKDVLDAGAAYAVLGRQRLDGGSVQELSDNGGDGVGREPIGRPPRPVGLSRGSLAWLAVQAGPAGLITGSDAFQQVTDLG